MNDLTTLEDQQRLLEKARVKSERQRLIRAERIENLTHLVSGVKVDSAKIVHLRRHMFKTDEELDKVVPKLTPQQRKIIRQFEEPKKNTAFGVESAAKLIEAETRSQADRQSVKINVENATIVLPEKREETVAPVVIDVAVDEGK